MKQHPEGNYSFFQNCQCEYFPCHETEDPTGFNCLFCYCPLYCLGDQCGGNYRFTASGIKDCTECLYPHKKENYSAVLSRFPEIRALMTKKDPSDT